MLPIIGITMGDPAGIGHEVIVKALSQSEVYQWCRPLVIGDAACLEKNVKICRLSRSKIGISFPEVLLL